MSSKHKSDEELPHPEAPPPKPDELGAAPPPEPDKALTEEELNKRSQERIDAALKESAQYQTIADEQRERSDEFVKAGQKPRDERTEAEKVSTPVAGVGHRPVTAAEGKS
jgi:hypothetical protein